MLKFFIKYHKWVGLFFAFFILMFAISGIFLNHRKTISGIDIPRYLLPKEYQYNNWNKGAVSGTLKLSPNKIIMYGNSGVWLSDSLMRNIKPYTQGMPKGIDNASIKSMRIVTPDSSIFAISTHRLYKMSKPYIKWEAVNNDDLSANDVFNDLYVKDDILYILMRSYIYKSTYPYNSFEKIILPKPQGYSPKVSLFRTIWILHSGELFGLFGKLVVDILGVIIILLTITGLIITFWMIPIKRRKKQKKDINKLKRTWSFSLRWHNKLGYLLFILLMILIVSGWFLRPPLLIPIVRAKVSPIPFSALDNDNPWHNKLRSLRYDAAMSKWIIYTSDGFYKFSNFNQSAEKISKIPLISVMGVNVWKMQQDSTCIIGSFSGIFKWDIKNGKIIDAITNKPYKRVKQTGPPVISNPIVGFSSDFGYGDVIFDYNKGAFATSTMVNVPQMPVEISNKGRISLWHTSLELHVGRLYNNFMGKFSPFFVFFAGLLFVFTLISGYVVYIKRFKKKKTKKKKAISTT